MDKEFMVKVDAGTCEKFDMALTLTGKGREEVIETLMRQYIAEVFGNIFKQYNNAEGLKEAETPVQTPVPREPAPDRENSKGARRIPLWARKPAQYNHRIIRAYFKAQALEGQVTVAKMAELCRNRDDELTYVPSFSTNYASMKTDAGNSQGHIFDDDGVNVRIWSGIKDVLMAYKDSFYKA